MLCACHCAMRDVLLAPLLVLITLVGVLLLRLRLDLRLALEPLIPPTDRRHAALACFDKRAVPTP